MTGKSKPKLLVTMLLLSLAGCAHIVPVAAPCPQLPVAPAILMQPAESPQTLKELTLLLSGTLRPAPATPSD
jgi:hypothetical protein